MMILSFEQTTLALPYPELVRQPYQTIIGRGELQIQDTHCGSKPPGGGVLRLRPAAHRRLAIDSARAETGGLLPADVDGERSSSAGPGKSAGHALWDPAAAGLALRQGPTDPCASWQGAEPATLAF